MKKLVNLACFIICLTSCAFSDEIFFREGESATTSIIDTTGCEVKILRYGNNVSIQKNLIEKIIWKSDTIEYSSYVCNEKPKEIVRFQDTPEYKLMLILDNSHETNSDIIENSTETNSDIPDKAKIAYMYSPLQGNYNSEEFVGVQSALIDLLKKKYELHVLNPSEIADEINSGKPKYDYAFFVRKYHVDINVFDQSGFFGNNYNGEKKKELFTTCDIIIYNLIKKEIVFHNIAVEKRVLWGENEYTWTSFITPAKWKDEWEKKQTDRKLDRNAKAITEKMKKELIKSLKIKDESSGRDQ